MYTATFFTAKGKGPDEAIAQDKIADGRGKTPYTAIKAAQKGLTMDHYRTGDTIGLHVHEGKEPLAGALITTFGTGAGEAASEARDMLKKAGAAGGR